MTRIMHRTRDDQGSAMIAALAVALIGMSLATVVVSQAIIVTRDAARDAIRTAEIHGAEAALDATLIALEDGYPCPGPTFSGSTVGAGADAVTIDVTIDYWDDAGPLTSCVAGQISGTPTGALVTATSDPVRQPPIGVTPERIFEMTLLLEPKTEENHGAAIFAASYLYTGAGLTLLPGEGGELGDVYLGTGDYNCQTKVLIEGNLYVPDGKITFSSNSCSVVGDVWSEGNFDIQTAKDVTVGGNVTIETGNLISHSKNIVINGDVTIGGVIVESGPKPGFAIGGTVTQNATVEDKGAVTIPVVNFDANAWINEGFVVRTPAYWADYMVTQVKANGGMTQPWQETNYRTHPCVLEQSEIGKKAIRMPSTKTVFDLRECTTYSAGTKGIMSNNQAVQFALYEDTAFILRGWDDRGSLTVTSGDGNEHKFFIIVPYELGTGKIETHTGSNVMPPIEVFIYTPGSVIFHNDSYTHGQVYGGQVEVHSGAYFYYTPADIPGATISVEPTVVGSNVIIVNKREVG